MYCYNCGCKLIEGASYCFKCGSKVVGADNPELPRTQESPMSEGINSQEGNKKVGSSLAVPLGWLIGILAIIGTLVATNPDGLAQPTPTSQDYDLGRYAGVLAKNDRFILTYWESIGDMCDYQASMYALVSFEDFARGCIDGYNEK